MKQLFVDILTKMTPCVIKPYEIQYLIKNGEKTTCIIIDWRYVNPNNVPKLEFILPFTSLFNDYSLMATTIYTQKIYTFRIDGCIYWMDFNPVEICEIDRIMYNIFSNYQTSEIKEIQQYLSLDDPKTTEQKFEEAQEAVANNE